ncbi:hypothetical protein ABBQ38_011674 [Trebouxia sp. C0009 RCD-2024]
MRVLPQLGIRPKPSLCYEQDDLVQVVPVASTLMGVASPATHDIVFAAVKEAAMQVMTSFLYDAPGFANSSDHWQDLDQKVLRGIPVASGDNKLKPTACKRAHDAKKLKFSKGQSPRGIRKKEKHRNRPAHWRRVALRHMFAGSQGLRDILRERGNPIELMEECDVKPLLQAALTTSQGCRLVDLDAEEVPDARITEVALLRLFPDHDWKGTPAGETITRRPGCGYILAEWLARTEKWPPCGQEALKVHCRNVRESPKKLKVLTTDSG